MFDLGAFPLAWWEWLVCSLGAFLVGVLASMFTDDPDLHEQAAMVQLVAELVAISTGTMSLILFVRLVLPA